MARARLLAIATILLAPCLLASPASAQARKPAPPDAVVHFIYPRDGQVVQGGKLWVRMGLRNMGVAPAGVVKDGTGHHHLLIDVEELPPLDEPIPNDRNHRHFGGGQTEARVEDLAPGPHTLQLMLADEAHVPFDPPVMRAGDLLSFIVQGHYPTNQLSPMIAGVAAEVINDPNDPPNGEPPHRSTELEPLTGTWRIFVRLQPRMLGTGPIEEPASQQQVPVSFSGEEGRVYEGLERAFRIPTYTVTSASPSTIDLSEGTQVTISGTNMPGQILVRWYSGTTYLESTANGCADVCNSVTAPPPAGITPGTYEIVAHLSVFTQETVVGLGNVTVVP